MCFFHLFILHFSLQQGPKTTTKSVSPSPLSFHNKNFSWNWLAQGHAMIFHSRGEIPTWLSQIPVQHSNHCTILPLAGHYPPCLPIHNQFGMVQCTLSLAPLTNSCVLSASLMLLGLLASHIPPLPFFILHIWYTFLLSGTTTSCILLTKTHATISCLVFKMSQEDSVIYSIHCYLLDCTMSEWLLNTWLHFSAFLPRCERRKRPLKNKSENRLTLINSWHSNCNLKTEIFEFNLI